MKDDGSKSLEEGLSKMNVLSTLKQDLQLKFQKNMSS